VKTQLVAICNVTPDSFSDGGAAFAAEAARERAREAFAAGAGVVDIGGQSTRPGAEFLGEEEEWSRIAAVLPQAVEEARRIGGKISVDTFYPLVAERALALGVDWINDVTGFRNPDMVAAVREFSCDLVLMHALDVPPVRGVTLDEGADAVAAAREFFRARLDVLETQGISSARVILDPGVGFGKTPLQSLYLLLRARELRLPGTRLLVGHSRKSFLSLFTDAPPERRDDLTLAFSTVLAAQGVEYLRVHEVPRHAALLAALSANMPHA
jgi:dihydropteroate synthase